MLASVYHVGKSRRPVTEQNGAQIGTFFQRTRAQGFGVFLGGFFEKFLAKKFVSLGFQINGQIFVGFLERKIFKM